jgi:dTDP-4-amino-4,6-dideoxygalactose transaminase
VKRTDADQRRTHQRISGGEQAKVKSEVDIGSKDEIHMLDLTPEAETLWDELNLAIQRVLRSGQFIMGPEVAAFEAEVAGYLGVGHAVGVNSGTDGLVIGLKALGISSGDEVITTPFTFFATAEAISQVGAVPVFVDIDPETYDIDPDLIEEKITARTRAILPVHLFGQAAEMNSILSLAEERGLKVLEDVAQAFGGEYRGIKLGTLGHAGAFSFFPSKNLGAYGDGGLVTTNDARVAEAARMLRAHGAKKKYRNELVGYNSRLDELQAAILRAKLPHVDEWNMSRREVAQHYNEMFEDSLGIVAPHEASRRLHVYHQYTVRIRDGRRDEVRKRLAQEGIGTMIYYPVPVHRLPVYSHLPAHARANLPHSEAAAHEVLSLPMGPYLCSEDARYVATETRKSVS